MNPLPTIIIANFGRCGSDVLYFTIARNSPYKTHPFVVNLKTNKWPKQNHLIKSHDIPPSGIGSNFKAIYLFGDPRNTAISTINRTNTIAHFRHMHVNKFRLREVFTRDALNLENHFDLWYRSQEFPLMTVRYETMKDHFDEISQFVGYNAKFGYRPRLTNWKKHREKKSLEKTYASLAAKIDAADDIKIWNTI